MYMERIASDDPLFRVSASMMAPVHVPLHHADRFEVYRPVKLGVANAWRKCDTMGSTS